MYVPVNCWRWDEEERSTNMICKARKIAMIPVLWLVHGSSWVVAYWVTSCSKSLTSLWCNHTRAHVPGNRFWPWIRGFHPAVVHRRRPLKDNLASFEMSENRKFVPVTNLEISTWGVRKAKSPKYTGIWAQVDLNPLQRRQESHL